MIRIIFHKSIKYGLQCLSIQLQTLGPSKYKINSLLNFGGRYIYSDNNQTPRLRVVQEKMINKLIQHVVIVMLMILSAFGMVVTIVAYSILFEGARVTLLGTELPFVDKDSDTGFWTNIFVQCLTGLVAVIACLAIEVGAVLIINALEAIPDLVHVDLKDLETELNLKGFTLEAKARLRNVFMKVQDYEKYFHR